MKKVLVSLAVALFFYSCATVSPYAKQGELYLLKGKYDEAVAAYEKALQQDPMNPQYKAGLYKAKLSAAIHYWMKGEEALNRGNKAQALAYYKKALYYQPSNEAVVKRIEKLTGKKVEKRRVTRYRAPRPKVSLHFAKARLKTIFQALGKYAGVNFIFDEGFRNINYSISMENVDFENALRLLCASTQNFYYKIDDKNYLIIPDTPQKREQYLAKKVKIFYLRYATVKNIRMALATMVITRMRRAITISYDQDLNAVIVKGTDEQISYIAQLIDRLDRPKGEVIIQAEILEVNRSRLMQAGLDLSQFAVGAQIITGESSSGDQNGQEGSSSPSLTLTTLRNLTGDDIAVIMPTAYLRFLETNTETRVMAKPLLRGIDGDKVTLKIGNKVPIPQTTFSPIAAGGLSIQPVTSFQYQDVGIVMEMEPRINSRDEVTLKIKIQVSSIAGTGYNNLPVLGNREVEMTARVKGGETVIIAGLFRNQETQTTKSPPFFTKIPLLGWLFSNAETRKEQTDVVIALTPYIVNFVEPSSEEEKAIITSEGRGLKLEKRKETPPAPQQKAPLGEKKGKTSSLNLFPRRVMISRGSNFTLSLTYRGEPIKSGEVVLEFSPEVELVDVLPGAFLDNQSFMKNKEDHRVLIGFTVKQGSVKIGQLAVVKFKLNGDRGEVSVISAILRDPTQKQVPIDLPEPVVVLTRK